MDVIISESFCHYLFRLSDCIDAPLHEHLAVLVAYSLHIARLVDSVPFKVAVLRHGLSFKLLAVHDQLDLVAVREDPYLDGLSLVNLLSNAYKFNVENGTITVSLEVVVVGDTEMVRLSVADTGKGISKEGKARVFDRFYQESTLSDNIGSGIGLNIVKEYVKLHLKLLLMKSLKGMFPDLKKVRCLS